MGQVPGGGIQRQGGGGRGHRGCWAGTPGGAPWGAAPGSPSQAPRPAPCPLAHQGPGTHATAAAIWPHPRAPRLAPPLPHRKASSTGRHTGSLGKAWPPGTKTRPPHACGHDPPPRAGSSVHVPGLHVCAFLCRQVSPAVCVGAACVHSVGACTLHACACARSTHRGDMGVCVCVWNGLWVPRMCEFKPSPGGTTPASLPSTHSHGARKRGQGLVGFG